MNHCFQKNGKAKKLTSMSFRRYPDYPVSAKMPERCARQKLPIHCGTFAASLWAQIDISRVELLAGWRGACYVMQDLGVDWTTTDGRWQDAWWQVFRACSLVHTNRSPARTSWVESPGGTDSFLPDFAPGWSCTAGVRLAVTRVIMCKKLPRNRTRDLYQTLWLYWRCSQLPRRIRMASKTVKEQPHWPRTSCLVFFHERGSGKCAEASSALKSRERCQENVGPVITPHGRADPAEDSSKDAVGLDEQRYDTNSSEFCFSTQNQQDKLTKYQSVLRSKLYGLVGSRR